MSSKILTSSASASPFVWKSIGEESSPDAASPQMGLPAVERPARLSEREELSSCRARIATLESEIASLQSRVQETKRVSFQEGLERGEANGATKWGEAIVRTSRTLAELAQHKPRLRREVETDAVRLALAIAKKVLHRELAVDPEAIVGLVRVAFEKVSARDVLRVRVSAADLAAVRSKVAELGIPERIEIVADPALESGSAMLDTNQGRIDASVATQLNEIERGLTDVLDRSERH